MKKFKDINEIKSDFKKMDMGIKTDVEILRELLQKYNKSDLGVEEKKSILIDLEYYLHQVRQSRCSQADSVLDSHTTGPGFKTWLVRYFIPNSD